MLTHAERLASARTTVDYITGRSESEQGRPVLNCPGWSVYNAAVHIGRVSIAWQEMIRATPDDPESRARGYDKGGLKPPGSPTADLAAWAHSAIDELDTDDLDRRCYFSMTGGEGSVRLWGWHVASELGVHRLDVEAALDHPPSLTDREAHDAVVYTCTYFLPAMRRVTETDPGGVTVDLITGEADATSAAIESAAPASVTLSGPPVQVLLALWGRPAVGVEITDGDPEVWASWRALPGRAFQFGTWD